MGTVTVLCIIIAYFGMEESKDRTLAELIRLYNRGKDMNSLTTSLLIESVPCRTTGSENNIVTSDS